MTKKKKEPITVIALSLPKSGSSLLGGILYHLGIYMGDEQEMRNRKDKYNPKGYFINRKFVSFMREITMKEWRDPPRVPKGLNEKRRGVLKGIIKEETRFPIWGFKNALTGFCINIILHYFTRPRIIVIHRSVEGITASFAGNYKYSVRKDRIRTLYNVFWKEIRKLRESEVPILELEFYEIIEKKEEAVEKIIEFLDLKVTEEQRKNTLDFIGIPHFDKEGNDYEK